MRVAVKEVGKDLQIVETNEKYRLDCIKQFIGKDNFPEVVMMNKDGTFCMGVNEDGLPLGLPLNFLFESSNPYYPIQKAVGTVVFIRTKYANPYQEEIWDFEVEDITDKDIETISVMLNDTYQNRLKEKFNDYGTGFAYFTSLQ